MADEERGLAGEGVRKSVALQPRGVVDDVARSIREREAKLQVGGEEIERFGSFETSFQENDSGSHSWPIPNVLGIRRREVR